MGKIRILCAVMPESVEEQRRVLEPAYDVTYVVTLDQAIRELAAHRFDLIICGIHFDNCQMLPLLQHCKNDPLLASIPFLCLRGYRGRLPESVYGQVGATTALLGGLYLDLTQKIDELGYERALEYLRNAIAQLLKEAYGDAKAMSPL